MRGANDSMETISAAATAIVTAEARVQQATSMQKRRWGSCWSGYWCFGSHRNGKRIGHAVLAPEPIVPGTATAPAIEIPSRPPSVILPFVAPPSSPASFLQSDPNSSTQSPAGLISFTSFSANVYSPGPNSIFAIGPYAHETNLVSPPVFSTFTTEPSTAPFTPPPEPVQLTTPSSPEVPFAQLLSSFDPNHRNSDSSRKFPLSHYEFQSYQLYPGSPIGHLISPSSVRSGASSPFPDCDFNSGGHTFLEFHTGDVPKLWNINALPASKWLTTRQSSGSLTPDPAGPAFNDREFLLENQISEDTGDLPKFWNINGLLPSKWVTTRQSSGSLTPDPAGPASNDREFLLENQISEVASLANSDNGSEISDMKINYRVSFELNAGEVATCLEKELASPVKTQSESLPDSTLNVTTTETDGVPNQTENIGQTSSNLPEKDCEDGEEEEQHIQQHPTLTSSESVKEFKFDNTDGAEKDYENGEEEQKHIQQQQPFARTSIGSTKEFKFDNMDGGTSDKPTVNADWWANDNVVAKESTPHNNWAFFPMMQPGVS